MNSITIGKLIFSKKAIMMIIFGLFCSGITLGAFIALSIETESKFNILLFLIFNIPIWILLLPKIKKEIIEKV